LTYVVFILIITNNLPVCSYPQICLYKPIKVQGQSLLLITEKDHFAIPEDLDGQRNALLVA